MNVPIRLSGRFRPHRTQLRQWLQTHRRFGIGLALLLLCIIASLDAGFQSHPLPYRLSSACRAPRAVPDSTIILNARVPRTLAGILPAWRSAPPAR